MTHVSELPYIVTEQIFKFAFANSVISIDNLSQQLVIPSVCREWRTQAIPLLSRTLYIESRDGLSYTSDDMTWVKSACVDSAMFKSNVSLLDMYNQQRPVKNLHLTLKDTAHLNSMLISIMVILQRKPQYLSEVTSLTFSYQPDTSIRDINDVEDIQNVELWTKVGIFIKSVTPRIPNISSLHFDIATGSDIIEKLCGGLIDQYSDNLKNLYTNHPVSYTTHSLSSNLTQLHISLDAEAGQQLPRISAKSLKSLTIDNAPYNFSWSTFSEEASTGDIILPELAKLNITYSISAPFHQESDCSAWRVGPEDTNGYKVHFPKLRALSIANQFESSDLSADDIYPAHLQALGFENSFETAVAFSQRVLMSADSLSVALSDLSAEQEDEFYKMTNSFFSKNHSSSVHKELTRHLRISNTAFALQASKVDWPSLTSLEFLGIVDLTCLAQLLPKTHLINALDAYAVSLISASIDANTDQSTPTTPLSASLESLRLRHLTDDSPKDIATSYVRNMALRLPSLKTFACEFS
ncbi:hypothetical protein LPJ53_001604 [Coemansia erecta]|uniref:Uncharacterized protein n=1 Tax=Coemansia erecta TaxID=147472 RepID=A0A9W7Y4J1_9FUNG|nr:hypothetical protein LPJ53_001604 [Coemansia erecta]